LAFMAPEILSHVNIGALSGGWANKDDAKPERDIIHEDKEETDNEEDDDDEEDVSDFEHESMIKKHIEQQQQSKTVPKHAYNSPSTLERAMAKPLPPPPPNQPPDFAQSNSGNHLAIKQKTHKPMLGNTARHNSSIYSSATSNTASSAGSGSDNMVVIKINTKTDAHYTQHPNQYHNPPQIALPGRHNNNNNNANHLNPQLNHIYENASASPSPQAPSSYNANLPSSNRTAPAIIRHNKSAEDGSKHKQSMMEMEQFNQHMDAQEYNLHFQTTPVTDAQKRFSREFIRKHHELASHKSRISPAPKKALPPAPTPGGGRTPGGGGGFSGLSQQFRSMFTSTSTAGNDYDAWQNRDIYFYNNANNNRHRFGNAYSQYTNMPSPNVANYYHHHYGVQQQQPPRSAAFPISNSYKSKAPHPFENSYSSNAGHNNMNSNNVQSRSYDSMAAHGRTPSLIPQKPLPQRPLPSRPLPPTTNHNINHYGAVGDGGHHQTLPRSPNMNSQQNIPQPPMAMLPTEQNDARFSTMSTIRRQKQLGLKAQDVYSWKALPVSPPKRKKQKLSVEYHARGRSASRYSARSARGRERRGSNYSRNGMKKNNRKESNLSANTAAMDDAVSVIYETHKFQIVYEASDSALYNDSVDVYSFGIIMWEVGLIERIYNQMDMKQIRDMVCEGRRMPTPKWRQCRKDENNGFRKVPKAVYNAYLDLVNDCWAQSPIDRPKFHEVESRLKLILDLYDMKMDQRSNHKHKNNQRRSGE